MKKYFKGTRFQLIVTFVIFSTCLLYLFHIPQTSSWLHKEDTLSGSYKIGRLDFWLDGIQDASIPININAIAPTRFFATGSSRDDNFDMVVQPYEIYGENAGDVDLKVDLSYIDSNSTNNSLYYIFIPMNTQDANFLSQKYRNYLDTVFSGYTLNTLSDYKTAMNAINQNTLNSIKGFPISVGADVPICYMLVWSEYDNINYGSSSQYVSVTYPLTIQAYAYQNFYTDS